MRFEIIDGAGYVTATCDQRVRRRHATLPHPEVATAVAEGARDHIRDPRRAIMKMGGIAIITLMLGASAWPAAGQPAM